jgi:hypothetical protein
VLSAAELPAVIREAFELKPELVTAGNGMGELPAALNGVLADPSARPPPKGG